MASWPNASTFSASSPGSSAPIDFEAPDGLPVDLIFMLIAPEAAGADHLKALAMSARLLRNARSRRPIARDPRSDGALRASDHGADLARGLSGREL